MSAPPAKGVERGRACDRGGQGALAPSALTRSAARALEQRHDRSADEPTRAAAAGLVLTYDAPRSPPLYFGGNVDRSLPWKPSGPDSSDSPHGERKQAQKTQKILPGGRAVPMRGRPMRSLVIKACVTSPLRLADGADRRHAHHFSDALNLRLATARPRPAARASREPRRRDPVARRLPRDRRAPRCGGRAPPRPHAS